MPCICIITQDDSEGSTGSLSPFRCNKGFNELVGDIIIALYPLTFYRVIAVNDRVCPEELTVEEVDREDMMQYVNTYHVFYFE